MEFLVLGQPVERGRIFAWTVGGVCLLLGGATACRFVRLRRTAVGKERALGEDRSKWQWDDLGEQADGTAKRLVWRMPKAGRISRLKIEEEILPPPPTGQMRIRVKAVGLNFADIFACLGLYGATPKGAFTPGLEFSGLVEAIGPNVTDFCPGDRVYGVTRFGAYASHLNSPSYFVRKLPDSWSFEEGASFVVQGLTAWHGLVGLGHLNPGETVLVHSAAGGVGLHAMDICQKRGALAIGTVGSHEKVDFLMEKCKLRRSQVLVRESGRKRFRAQLQDHLEACGWACEGFDVIMDSLGGVHFEAGMEALSRNGRMVMLGMAHYMTGTADTPNWWRIIPKYLRRPKIDPAELIGGNKSVMGFNLIWLTDKEAELNAELDSMLEHDWQPPHIGRTFAFNEATEALRFMQSGASVGKVVLVLP